MSAAPGITLTIDEIALNGAGLDAEALRTALEQVAHRLRSRQIDGPLRLRIDAIALEGTTTPDQIAEAMHRTIAARLDDGGAT